MFEKAVADGKLTSAADLASFCQAEYPRLLGALTLYCGNQDVAEELAHEAIARVCLHWRKVRQLHAPGAWAHRVAMNLAKSYFTRRVVERRLRDRALNSEQSVAPPPSPDGVVLRASIARLPRRQRMALVLRYYGDLSLVEIADAMGCATGTVKSHLRKAIENLRRDTPLATLEEEP